MPTGSRQLIHDLFEHRTGGRIPWTFDFGSCKGLNPGLLPAAKKHFGAAGSLTEFLDYDIWIVLDPDRIHSDPLPHTDETIKAAIPADTIQCMMPLKRQEGFDYERFYESELASKQQTTETASFDAFGLYYFSWPGHPNYVSFLSPLEQVTDLTLIKEFPMPTVDSIGFDYFKKDVSYISSKDKMSAAWSGSLYELSWYLRGRERILYDYFDNPQIVEIIVDKAAAFTEQLTQRNLEAGVDVLCFYDDLGTQASLFISPEIFRRFYKPYYKRIWQRIKKEWKGRYIFLHACGNISQIIPDLIDCGLDILNPVQPEAIDPNRISDQFSKDLVLWGSIGVQKTLTSGSKHDIFHEIHERVKRIGMACPLILSPANTLPKETPLQNLDYFVEACKEYCTG